MKHATWNAVCEILGTTAGGFVPFEREFKDHASCHAACDWTITDDRRKGIQEVSWFTLGDAIDLIEGRAPEGGMPECEGCCVQVDQALELRWSRAPLSEEAQRVIEWRARQTP